MSTAICCAEPLQVIRYLSVGDYVWIKGKRIREKASQPDDFNSFVRTVTGLDYTPSGLPLVK